MYWVYFASLASIIIAISWYLRKKILLTHKLNNLMFYMYIGVAISAITLSFVMKDKDKDGFKQFSNETKLLAILSGVFLPFGAYCISRSLSTVKNPAYSSIVFAVFKTILLLAISVYLLNSSYNKFTLLGIVFALIGVSLITLNY
tara:strand:- start:10292 stop:10726 length:435 start_codon:yes stop_codon:yes gene_type:complete